MAHHLDLLECVGMSRTEMRQERAQRLMMKRAYHAARLKAESEERRLDRILEEDDERYFRLIPDKDYIAAYFLEERSDWMRNAGLRYRYGVPIDDADPEITLQVWKRDPDTGDQQLEAIAGDLYTVSLITPCGTATININLIVESSESRRYCNSWLQFSTFDVGHSEKAWAIPGESWYTYLMWREDSPDRRKELDTRLLFVAIGDYSQIGDNCKIEQFRNFNVDDIIILMQNMSVGKVYPRPTSEEALLSMEQGGAVELLRSDPDFPDMMNDSVGGILTDRFREMTIANASGKGDKIKPSKVKQPRAETLAEVDLSLETSQAIMEMLTRCVQPSPEEAFTSGEWRRSVREIRDLGSPIRMDFSNSEMNKISRGKQKLVRRKLSKERRYAEAEKEERATKIKDRQEARVPEERKKEGGKSMPEEEKMPEKDDGKEGKEGEKRKRSSSDSATQGSTQGSMPESILARFPELTAFKFVTYVDDVGLVETTPKKMTFLDKLSAKPQSATGELNPVKEVKDIIPDFEDWVSEGFQYPVSDEIPDMEDDDEKEDEDEILSDISYLFNDSIEIFLAKTPNESQVITVSTGESSVTDNDPEEFMEHTSCESCDAASRDHIDDEDLEDDLFLPESE